MAPVDLPGVRRDAAPVWRPAAGHEAAGNTMRGRLILGIAGALTMAAGLGLTAPALSPPARAASAPAASCAAVWFLGARGSGEKGPGTKGWHSSGGSLGMGGEVTSAYDRVRTDLAGLDSVQATSLSYAADSVWTLVRHRASYFAGLSAGVSTAVRDLNSQASRCPKQRFVLAGYSQGAMVLHRALHRLDAGAAGRRTLTRVSAAILIGDGDQVPHDTGVVRYGTAPSGAKGIGQRFASLSGASSKKFSRSVGSRALSVCDLYDVVCDWSDINWEHIDRGIKVHLAYTGSKPLLEAADHAAGNVLSKVGWTDATAPLPAGAHGLNGSTAPVAACPPGAARCLVTAEYMKNAAKPGGGVLLTGSGTSWSKVTAPVPSGSLSIPLEFAGAACASASSCVAVDEGQGVLEAGSGSHWSALRPPAPADGIGVDGLSDVACGSAKSCVVVGGYSGTDHKYDAGLLLTGLGTSWTAVPLPESGQVADTPAGLESVACPTASFCAATGSYGMTGQDPLLVTGHGTTWQTAVPKLPSGARSPAIASLNSVACSSAAHCVAVGGYETKSGNYEPLLEVESASGWQAREAPIPADGGTKKVSNELTSVACPSATLCVAAGEYMPGTYGGTSGLLVTGSGSSWQARATQASMLTSVACESAESCVVVGDGPYAARMTGSYWHAIPLTWQGAYPTIDSVSCAALGTCVAAGTYENKAGTTEGTLYTGPG
jgi:hypothetical protein